MKLMTNILIVILTQSNRLVKLSWKFQTDRKNAHAGNRAQIVSLQGKSFAV